MCGSGKGVEWMSGEHLRGAVVSSQVGGRMFVSKDIGTGEENYKK